MNVKEISEIELQKCDQVYAICRFNPQTWHYDSLFKGKLIRSEVYYGKDDERLPLIFLENGNEQRIFWLNGCENSYHLKYELRCKKDESNLHFFCLRSFRNICVWKISNGIYSLFYFDPETDSIQEFVLDDTLRIKGIPEDCYLYFDGEKLVSFGSSTITVVAHVCKCKGISIEKIDESSVNLRLDDNRNKMSFYERSIWENQLRYFPKK